MDMQSIASVGSLVIAIYYFYKALKFDLPVGGFFVWCVPIFWVGLSVFLMFA